jgi:TetR/AcrR family fatty acid metabolism transcriptional regulator
MKKNKDNKRERIISAAIAVFANNGFYNAKVAEIAKEAGVADGTIYLYFQSKEDILISIFEEEIEKVIQIQLTAISKTSDPSEQLKIFAGNHLNLIRNNPKLAELLQIELRQSTKFMKKYKHEKFLNYLNIIGNIFAAGQDYKIFNSSLKITTLKIIFVGALDEFATQWLLSKPKNLSIEKATAQICDVFLKGITI